MVADPAREIPIDEDFCERMVAARKKAGWNQRQLASRIGTSQNTISLIESGGASKLIPTICKVLKIPGPLIGFSERQRSWTLLGHELEKRSAGTFTLALERMEALLAELPAKDDDKPPPTEPPAKKPPVPLSNRRSAATIASTHASVERATSCPANQKSSAERSRLSRAVAQA